MKNKREPGDKIYIPCYDSIFPEESEVKAKTVLDVGTKGIYLDYDGEFAEFYSYDDIGKVVFTNRKDAQNELLCIMARS